ncbi:MAG: aldo/keto reductase [Bryobacteraceae bacterium]|nr:aldo/keto reductase [Bryobacteraceae bacterium]
MELSHLRTLGRSGLPVSPLALGTMTFGNKGWGSTDDVSRRIFEAYVQAGGNFVDTADVYSGGRSEELVGSFIGEGKLRDRIVLATKFGFSGGNGRKNMNRALESSLGRLGTDYVDLYWVHVWDAVTPAEELLQTMGELVRSGKIRYFGLSDVPAWYAARMATLAQTHNVPGPIALQLVYSLVERVIEHEHIPAARELGMAVTPWSPLGAGFLTGKYSRDSSGNVLVGGGRLDSNNQPFRMFSERNWKILDTLREVSRQADKPMSQVALAWASGRPGITSLILGASTPEQLDNNLASLELELSADQLTQLQEASAFDPLNFYSLFEEQVNRSIFKGLKVDGWSHGKTVGRY